MSNKEEIMNQLKGKNVVILGQTFTSRTETLEEYFRDKASKLFVIGINSPFFEKNRGRCTLYINGKLSKQFKLLHFKMKDFKWYRQPLFFIVYLVNSFLVFYSLIRIKEKFDIFIGISHFAGLAGLIAKKFGFCRKVIFYSIDYYKPVKKISFHKLINYIEILLDKITARSVDMVWNITESIHNSRETYGQLSKNNYACITVPLCYSSHLMRFVDISNVERDTCIFIGTIARTSGLQLAVEAIPKLKVQRPDFKIRVIGQGPYMQELKNLISKYKVEDSFVFHGFIENETEVFDIISRCAVGLALWNNNFDDSNIESADPGKLKLYMMCGVPFVCTKVSAISLKYHQLRVGIAIDYDVNQLVDALVKLLKNTNDLNSYKNNIRNYSNNLTSEYILSKAIESSL